MAGRPPRLETARLSLDAPCEADLDELVEQANDPDVARHLGRLPHPYTADDARHFIDELCPRETNWCVRRRDDGRLAGVVGFAETPDGTPELGYWFGKAHWGAGFATEGARAALDYTFNALAPADRILSGCFTSNAASANVLRKLGFSVIGRSARFSRFYDRALDHADLALTGDVWRRVRSAAAAPSR